MNKLPQPIPYQGSKRNIAPQILEFFPKGIERLVEPFAGSAAISIATAKCGLADRFLLNDFNAPLTHLLQLMIEQPDEIANQYQELWFAQLGREREFYDEIRDKFNQTHRPEFFLYLLARCVKASIRYNTSGQFNQAPDNRRKGRHPASMRQEIFAFSKLLKNKTEVTQGDFRQTLMQINAMTDFVYLDPPYQGTSGTRDTRYASGVQLADLIGYLQELNQKDVMFALSYDGVKGDKTYGVELPETLALKRVLVHAGRSTQSTLLGRNDITYESLYLSPALATQLHLDTDGKAHKIKRSKLNSLPTEQIQLELQFL